MENVHILAIVVVALVILLLGFKKSEHNEMVDRDRLIMSVVARVVTDGISYKEFTRIVDHPKFNVNAYDKLVYTYKQGNLNEKKIRDIMKEYPTIYWELWS